MPPNNKMLLPDKREMYNEIETVKIIYLKETRTKQDSRIECKLIVSKASVNRFRFVC